MYLCLLQSIKHLKLWITKALYLEALHYVLMRFLGQQKGTLVVQHPIGIRINCGNISSFMLMLTKYVAGVYHPIILNLFMFLKIF